MFWKSPVLILFFLALSVAESAAQNRREILGIRPRPEIIAMAGEIEKKLGRQIYAEFSEFSGDDEQFMLGSSFVSDDGIAVLRAKIDLRGQNKMLEAVIGHELLHLRLRANGYPVFLFSPKVKTRRGLAQDTEQSIVNDLQSLIEHRIFRPEMERLGISGALFLDEDTLRSAEKSFGREDGQADAINYARAILEYKIPRNVRKLKGIYAKNKWSKSIAMGETLARFISQAGINSPADVESVFARCLATLYPAPRPVKLTRDARVKAYRLMMISY
jgi:hypothetical protein